MRIGALLLALAAWASQAAAGDSDGITVVPEEMISASGDVECRQYTKVYDADPPSGPLYLTRALSGTEDDIAAFWCMRASGEPTVVFLGGGPGNYRIEGEIRVPVSVTGLSWAWAISQRERGNLRWELREPAGRLPLGEKYEGAGIRFGADTGALVYYEAGRWFFFPGDL